MNLPIKLKIPDSFYQEEERCGHLVTAKDKKIWAVELDLLNEFKTVCEKYNLRWYVAYGTLLGTIRHKGFIPWDNDVDVWMPREDFRELCQHADEFEHPYFLQTPITEKGKYFMTWGKLCNSLTTGSCEWYTDQGINGGLFIDIFILDDFSDNLHIMSKKINKFNYYCHFEQCFHRREKFSFSINYLKHIVRRFLWNTLYQKWDGATLFHKIDSICGSTLNHNCVYYGIYGTSASNNAISPKTIWEKVEYMKFEILLIPVPCGYNELLTMFYGDYMKLPAIENRKTHEYLIMDPEVSYKNIIC